MKAGGWRGARITWSIVALLMACAGSKTPTENDDAAIGALLREGAWQRAEIRGISVYSNASPDRTRAALGRLSRFLDLAEILTGGEFRPGRPVEVLLFAKQIQWEPFSPPGYTGRALTLPDRYVLAMSLEHHGLDVLSHELVHLVLDTRPGVGDYPRWYHEGLAEVLGGAVIRDDVAMVGSVAGMRLGTLEHTDPLPLDEILSNRAFDGDGDQLRDRAYADAFAFVHFGLLGDDPNAHTRAAEFNRFVSLCRGGEDWHTAFSRAFSDDFAAVDAAFRRHRAELGKPGATAFHVFDLTRPVPSVDLEPAPAPEMSRALHRFAEAARQ